MKVLTKVNTGHLFIRINLKGEVFNICATSNTRQNYEQHYHYLDKQVIPSQTHTIGLINDVFSNKQTAIPLRATSCAEITCLAITIGVHHKTNYLASLHEMNF